MNQQVAEIKHGTMINNGRMAVADVVQQTVAIQEVMRAVMKPNIHYGTIPGTDKPTLYKAGAEKLCLAFHIADTYVVEDLSAGPDAIRYRVTCIGHHQQTGIEMGQGLGESQTSEEKYRWRKAVCKEEFEETAVNMRRVKYAKAKGGGFYTVEQVRTEPADLANTVLKMAAKRAKTAMVLNVLAASDAFGQDLEDLDATLREHLAEDGGEGASESKDRKPPPTRASDRQEDGKITVGQLKNLQGKIKAAGLNEAAVQQMLTRLGIPAIDPEMTLANWKVIKAEVEKVV